MDTPRRSPRLVPMVLPVLHGATNARRGRSADQTLEGNSPSCASASACLRAWRCLVPQAATVGVLLNPNWPPSANQLRDVQDAARVVGLQINVLRASTDQEIDAAVETVAQQRIAALAVTGNPFYDTRREKLVALAARHAVPVIYQFREFTAAGGLMSYGIDLPDAYRQVGVYVGRVLKGAKPADLPVLQPTKFEFVINLKTAKALGVKFSDNLMSLADEVIE